MQHDWEIWLDNHISPIIAKWLKDKTGLEVKSTYVLQLYSLTDFEIYSKAKKAGKEILVICEKSLYTDEIAEMATSGGFHYLNYKVPAGFLTNFDTLITRIK